MRPYALCILAFLLVGCMSDEPATTAPTPSEPPARVPADVDTDGLPDYRTLPEKFTTLRPEAFGDAAGGVRIRLWNDRAYVSTGTTDQSIAIFDITNPLEPEHLGNVESSPGAREGLDILHYGDRTVAVASLASPVAGPIVFWDVTDPTAVEEIARFDVQSHTVAAFRSAHVVYNSGFATGQLGGTEIIDARDPDDIKVAKVWDWGDRAQDGTPIQPTGCHDITVDPIAKRGYCAAQFQTLVWDLQDPLNPTVITAVNDPFVPHHNTAFPILGGRVLAIGDEEGGCAPEPPAAADAGPAGAVWFYNLATSPPALLGWVSPVADTPEGSCAAHFGGEVGTGTGMVAFGWFGAGLVLIDASTPSNPHIVFQTNEGGSASAAEYYRGLVFAAGSKGGLQVAVPE